MFIARTRTHARTHARTHECVCVNISMYVCMRVFVCACVCILMCIICAQVGSRVQRPRGVPVASTTDWCHEQMARTVPVFVTPTTNVPIINAWPPCWVEVINRPRPTDSDVVSTNAPAVRYWLEECVNLPVKVEDDAGYSYSPASPTKSYSAQF